MKAFLKTAPSDTSATVDHAAKLTFQNVCQHFLFAAALPLAALALATPFAAWSWLAGLCLHLSWQASLALLPVMIAVRRHRGRAGFLLLAMMVGFWPWVLASYASRAPLAHDDSLKIATGNLFDFNEQRSTMLDVIGRLDVDLLAVQEVLKEDEAILTASWPHAVWNHDRELLGSALLSRHPIPWSHIHDLEGFALVEALVRTPGGDLRVFVVHLASPKRPTRAAIQDRQLIRLAQLVHASAEPVVIVGDFNFSSGAPQWRRFTTTAQLQRPPGISPGTWPTWLGPLGIDIDHIAGRGVGFSPLQVWTIPGSDHRGLITQVSLR